MRAISLLAGAVLAAVVLVAAEPELCILVRDPGSLPVPGAEVTVEPHIAAPVLRGLTDDSGRFCRSVRSGGHTIRIRHEGLMGAASPIFIEPGSEAVEREFVLSIGAIASQVQVTASRLPDTLLDVPTPVRQLDRNQMEKLGARQLNDALQEQPEVVTFAGGSHANGGSTNLQGFTSRNVEILVDGQPLSGRISGYIDLNQIDSSLVEAVEIKTGASAMTYGLQGLGGAINLITRRPTSGASATVESGYGSFNTGLLRADAGFAARGWAALFAGAMQRSLGYDLDPSTAVKSQNANRIRNVLGSVYLPEWRNVTAGATMLWTEQTYWGFDVSTANTIYDFNRPKKRVVLVPRATMALSSSDLLSVRARRLFYRSGEDLVYRMPLTISAGATTQEANGGEIEWTMARPTGLRSVAGLFYNRQDIRGSNLGTPDGNAERESWSQISSLEYPFRRVLKLQGGYRFDHDSAFGNKISPQFVAAWRIREGLSLSSSVTRGFRAPDFNELYLNNSHAGGRVKVLGNTDLRPEQSWSATAGALWIPGDNMRIEGQLFEHRLEDMILSPLIGREGTASIYRYQNVGNARIRGALVSFETALNRRIELGGSYQLLHTRDLGTAVPLEYSPRHRACVRTSWSSPAHGLLMSFFGNLTGRTFFSVSNSVADYMSGFEVFGVNVQKDLKRNVTVRMTFRNLSDNVDPLYRITAPFSIEGSIRIRLRSGE